MHFILVVLCRDNDCVSVLCDQTTECVLHRCARGNLHCQVECHHAFATITRCGEHHWHTERYCVSDKKLLFGCGTNEILVYNQTIIQKRYWFFYFTFMVFEKLLNVKVFFDSVRSVPLFWLCGWDLQHYCGLCTCVFCLCLYDLCELFPRFIVVRPQD